MRKRVALLDAGAQLEKVIMRRVLEQGHDVDKFPMDVPAERLERYDAIILSGGPRSVYAPDALLPDTNIYRLRKPILGICYGLQAIVHQHGGKVVHGQRGQYGRNIVDIVKKEGIFAGLAERERVLMSHFDVVAREGLPLGFEIYGESEGIIAAIGDWKRRIYATQFHPEMTPMTKHGQEMFTNFFQQVCGFLRGEQGTTSDELAHAERHILEAVGGDKRVMHYVSGGVDSTVMALLLSRCVEPERLFMRVLDTGAMRQGEIEAVTQMARELHWPNFKVIDASDRFYASRRELKTKQGTEIAGPLWNTVEPKRKRKLFGTEYAEIALEEMRRLAVENNVSFEKFLLGQGTLRPDVIESGDTRATLGGAHTIKTHHNAVEALKAIPKVEPLIELFKDQVRRMGIALGLPEAFAYKQPFPGPGLYCRVIGDRDEAERIPDGFSALDERVQAIACKQGLCAHVLPIRSVGVQGDERSYKHPVVISGEIDWQAFAQFALDLPNEVREINRVLYAPGKPLTLEESLSLTPTLLTPDALQQARSADAVMHEVAEAYGYNDSRKCSQMPGILIPCNFGEQSKRSFVVRPCWTHDFMAIIGMMPAKKLPETNTEEFFPEAMFLDMEREIKKRVPSIARVILDASDKPPASTEWE